MLQKPSLIKGGSHADDRGMVRFINDFDFQGVRRFYHASNHHKNFVRAWQGHEREGKYVYVASGSALVAAVKLGRRIPEQERIGGITHDRCQDIPQKFTLSAMTPAILWIPPGYANGWMNLEDGTNVLFFSTATVDKSKADDFRFPADHWDIWGVGPKT